MFRKGKCILLAALLLLCTAGCGKAEPAGSPAASSAPEETGEVPSSPGETELPTAEELEYRLIRIFACTSEMATHATPENREEFEGLDTFSDEMPGWQGVEEAVNRKLEETINTHIELVPCCEIYNEATGFYTFPDSREEWLALELAAGEVFDIVTPGRLDSSTQFTKMFYTVAAGGMLTTLDELLPRYAPSLWSKFSTEEWDSCRYDGKIICIPGALSRASTEMGLAYRADWARLLGMDSVDTYDDLERYMEGVSRELGKKVLTDGGSKALFKLYLQTHGYGAAVPITMSLSTTDIMAASPETWWEPVDTMTLPETRDYLDKAREWYTSGYWDNSAATNIYAVAGLSSAGGFFNGESAMAAASPRDYAGLMDLGSVLSGTTGVLKACPGIFAQYQPEGELAYTMLGKTATCGTPAAQNCILIPAASADPARALLVLEILEQDREAAALINYGIEGIHYTLQEDGSRRMHNYEDTDVYFVSPFYDTVFQDEDILADWEWQQRDEFLQSWMASARANPYGMTELDLSAYTETQSVLTDLFMTDYFPLLYGIREDPQAALDDYLAEREAAGFTAYFNEIQRQLAAAAGK